jgi:DNA-directed RNA polymerase subunit E"
MSEKACLNCRLIVLGEVCPLCKQSNLSKKWEGYIYVEGPEGKPVVDSEVAKEIGAQVPGKYALKMK